MLSVNGDADAAVEARIQIGWNEFRQLAPLLTIDNISLIMTGRLYSSCVRSRVLHGSETWPIRKENELALQLTKMRMVRWMRDVKVKDRVPSKELGDRLGIDNISRYYSSTTAKQIAMLWASIVKRSEYWVKKCMEYEVEGSRPRVRPKRTRNKVVQKTVKYDLTWRML